jgi:ferritin
MQTLKRFKAMQENMEIQTIEIPGLAAPETLDMSVMDAPQESVPVVVTSGVPKPKCLSPEIVEALEARLKDEYTAHYTYRNAANWCKNKNYKAAAAYFEGEAAEELQHAAGLQDYMIQWNCLPQIPPVTVPNDFTSLVHIIGHAYDIEYALLEEYSHLQHSICAAHPATFNFIQKYVDIQNESVASYSDLLNALELINIDSKLDILVFEGRYFG